MTTPLPIDNRPGLDALRYRIGSYGDFLDSMLGRLADRDPKFSPLNALRTRSTDDPTIALIDAFSVLGDILTFYQERLANEGYLRTATQAQSLQYLSSLTGYQMRPGVASSVALAFTVDPKSTVTLAAGSRVQSVPGPGQTAQSYEIDNDLQASGDWSALQPRLTRPTQPAPDLMTVTVAGTSTGLKANDPILQVVNGAPMLRRVARVAPDSARQRTVITLQPPKKSSTQPQAPAPPEAPSSSPSAPAAASALAAAPPSAHKAVLAAVPGQATATTVVAPVPPSTRVMQLAADFGVLASKPPASYPPNPQSLTPSTDQRFATDMQTSLDLSAGRSPAQRAAVFTALSQKLLAPPPQLEFHAFRAKTAPFGNRAVPQVVVDTITEWTREGRETHSRETHTRTRTEPWPFSAPTETSRVLYLDGAFETITPGSWVAFDAPVGQPAPDPVQVDGVDTVSRAAYGLTARTSRLTLSGKWFLDKATFESAIQQASVYADSVKLTLAEEDIDEPVAQSIASPTLELDGLVDGLSAGRWMVVSGERSDLPGVTAVERVMLASVSHGGEVVPSGAGPMTAAGETPHTTLTFASPLAFSYKRSTVNVFANVMTATQGESTGEILGSGNSATANQTFPLRKSPLTFVPAATPSGVASTLRVWVNNIEWRQVDTLASAAPDARVFVAATKADGGCSVQFGDSVHGARLPTGTENVRAHYRAGLGSSGNVDPGTITTLLTRPLGVTSVTNPGAASGGADAESLDDARANIPLGMGSLARLVSVADYQNFALAFSGVGKAAARRFEGPDGPLIYLTLAGAHDNALDPSNPTWTGLRIALRQYGDPSLEVELAARAERLAIIKAGVAVNADQKWADVEQAIRSTLLKTFGFSGRALGQSMYVSEVIATIQGVPGVAYVDLRQLVGVAQTTDPTELQSLLATDKVGDIIARQARVDPAATGRPKRLLPAELVYLSARPDKLALIQTALPS